MFSPTHHVARRHALRRTVTGCAALALVATGTSALAAPGAGSAIQAAPEVQAITPAPGDPGAYTHDWNGDGRADLLAVASNGNLLLYAGDGRGGFARGTGTTIGTGWQAFDQLQQVGDWDGNGTPDIVARLATSGSLMLYQGNGTGGFARGAGTKIGHGWGAFDEIVASGDWTGDGWPDLIASNPATQFLYVYPGSGPAGFAAPQQLSNRFALTPMAAVGDFTGEGFPDLVAVQNGQLRLYPSDGAGLFARGAGAVVGQNGWGSFSVLVGPGDWTGKGATDLIARDASGQLLLFRGSGTGAITHSGPNASYSAVIGSRWNGLVHIF